MYAFVALTYHLQLQGLLKTMETITIKKTVMSLHAGLRKDIGNFVFL